MSFSEEIRTATAEGERIERGRLRTEMIRLLLVKEKSRDLLIDVDRFRRDLGLSMEALQSEVEVIEDTRKLLVTIGTKERVAADRQKLSDGFFQLYRKLSHRILIDFMTIRIASRLFDRADEHCREVSNAEDKLNMYRASFPDTVRATIEAENNPDRSVPSIDPPAAPAGIFDDLVATLTGIESRCREAAFIEARQAIREFTRGGNYGEPPNIGEDESLASDINKQLMAAIAETEKKK